MLLGWSVGIVIIVLGVMSAKIIHSRLIEAEKSNDIH